MAKWRSGEVAEWVGRVCGGPRRALCHFATLPLCHFVLASAAAHPTGTIALRPVARVEAGVSVTLADVARLDGPAAEALGGVVLLPDGATADWTPVDAAAVRAAIDASADPVWGHLVLVGDRCSVRSFSPPSRAAVAPSGAGAELERETDPTTVRAVIERRLAAGFECAVGDLRLEFGERDRELLATSAIGRTVDVQPTGFSERLPLRITLYEGDRILRAVALRVNVLVRREVVVAPAGLPRGHVIGEADLLPDVRWLAPDIHPISAGNAVGLVVRSRIAPGETISTRAVESPILVTRGQTLQVHAADGAVSLQIPARALEDGREGDVIRCITITAASREARRARDPGREFLARLAGPGLAVAVDDPAESPVVLEPLP